MNTTRINLTQEAREALDHWFERNAPQWAAEGADVNEVREDVEAHLMAEFPNREKTLEIEDVHGALNSMGLPAMGISSAGNASIASIPSTPPIQKIITATKRGRIARFLKHITSHWFWVVLWPLGVMGFEILTDFCASSFFAPIPTWFHAILIISACAGGWYHFRKIHPTDDAPPPTATPLHTIIRFASLLVAGYWSLLLIPILIMGLTGYIAGVTFSFGIALIAFPIFLICALIAAAPMLLLAGLIRNNNQSSIKSMRWTGLTLGLILLILVEGPSYITRYGMATGSPGIIRTLGSEKVLLQMCYEKPMRMMGSTARVDSAGYLLSIITLEFSNDLNWGAEESSLEEKREMYYRVTGNSFNSVAKPKHLTRRTDRGTGFELDENLGGDGVFARVNHLDMSASRLDGHIDHASGLGYWEWTMEFSNTSQQNKEARMQVLLPPNGVVSRLTLWVNGQPQEAAFSSTAKVTRAYKKVAVERRRDPVLVRWMAPDRVLVQCFPVPVGGKMKIRLGVTAPLDRNERFYLPRIIEQNFGFKNNGGVLETDFWIQGDVDLTMKGVESHGESGRWKERHGKLSAEEQANHHTHVQCHGPDQGKRPTRVWTIDPFASDDARILVRETIPDDHKKTGTKKSSVVVIDGSSGTAQWRDAIADALDELEKSGHELHVVMAANDQTMIGKEHLRNTRFVGGQNNLDALNAGYELATQHQASNLIWIHGDQPVTFSSTESLIQRMERGFFKPKLMTVDLTGGSNQILEDLSRTIHITAQARPSDPTQMLAALKEILNPSSTREKWTTYPTGTTPEKAVKVWDHLARWKVWREVLQSKKTDTLIKKAALYQLVTPVSGAVVLETKAQYKEFGLTQADPNSVPTVPTIPEPSTALLTLLGFTLILFRRNRHPGNSQQ